jgi:hypothetical protein
VDLPANNSIHLLAFVNNVMKSVVHKRMDISGLAEPMLFSQQGFFTAAVYLRDVLPSCRGCMCACVLECVSM